MTGRRNGERRVVNEVRDGSVPCPRLATMVDAERCLACGLQRGLQRDGDGGVTAVTCGWQAPSVDNVTALLV